MDNGLTEEEKKILLKTARGALEDAFRVPHVEEIPPPTDRLLEKGVTFVTLTIDGQLRGCVGALEPYQPLIEDVKEHALAAAFQDYRFSPLRKDELPFVEIEISRLTKPEKLEYETPEELVRKIRPGIDGVVLQWRGRRATFLPQVWEKIPTVDEFLDHLCMKMGVDAYLWRKTIMDVYIYQVEEFHEAKPE
jgi:AmmeMemoRadiSam system protein A